MDFRKIITKMRDLDPTTPSQDLQHYSTLAESTGIALGARQVAFRITFAQMMCKLTNQRYKPLTNHWTLLKIKLKRLRQAYGQAKTQQP